jgi:tetratricopeptide (TPR) repeat protein
MLSHLPQLDVKVDKSQYECLMKADESYWINKKVELDANDIGWAKIEMEIWPLTSQKPKIIEIPSEGVPNIDLERYDKAFKVEMFFNQRGRKKLENVTKRNIGGRLAMIFGGKLLMAPIIHEKITNGKVEIVGLSYSEAKRLNAAIGKSLIEDNVAEADDLEISYDSRSIEIDPGNVIAYDNRGNAYVRKGQYDQAILDYTRALEIDPKYETAYYNRGIAYMDKGQFDQAVADYSKAIELNPKLDKAYYHRGDAYVKKGQYDQAIADYNKAIEISPNNSTAYNNLAWLLATTKESKYRDGEKAVDLALKACELSDWKNAYCLGTLAATYARMGDFNNAVKWQKKALESYEEGLKDETKEKLRTEGQQRLNFYLKHKPWSE